MFGRASLKKREEEEVQKKEKQKLTVRTLNVSADVEECQVHAKFETVAVSAAEILSNTAALQGTTVNTQASVKKSW